MSDILATLRQDHVNMTVLVDILERQIDIFDTGGHPDMGIVTAIAEYALDYPARFHHPVEDMVYARMCQRDPASAAGAGSLLAEHRHIDALARRFHDMLDSIMSDTPARRTDLGAVAHEFIVTMRRHIAGEEAGFLLQAAAILSAADLAEIATRAPAAGDPLFGAADRDSYVRLRHSIVDWAENAQDGKQS